ncbi:hypothetical protein CEP52_006446 [Fusarium oligoseptatum]|uniref:Uncharacterized protein n=1 Tax=Fusarium oligoseptatum TaxID=2604345 RepID=A0A428TSZ6_9HYPO|nr:hypothetical protein CEP52_006446 [Fusarium oligoseptatum]
MRKMNGTVAGADTVDDRLGATRWGLAGCMQQPQWAGRIKKLVRERREVGKLSITQVDLEEERPLGL